jgi:hypothetical protein
VNRLVGPKSPDDYGQSPQRKALEQRAGSDSVLCTFCVYGFNFSMALLCPSEQQCIRYFETVLPSYPAHTNSDRIGIGIACFPPLARSDRPQNRIRCENPLSSLLSAFLANLSPFNNLIKSLPIRSINYRTPKPCVQFWKDAQRVECECFDAREVQLSRDLQLHFFS